MNAESKVGLYCMSEIPLTRCQFVIPFTEICNEIGAPTSALLSKFQLPTSLEEKFNHFIPLLPAVNFAHAAQRSHGIDDIACQAVKRMQFEHLSERMRAGVRHSPTLFAALKQVCRLARLEDTILNMWLEDGGDHLKICSRLDGTAGLRHLEHSYWFQNVFTVFIVRQFTGPNWSPATMAFESHFTPGLEAQASWPNTKLLTGQKASWIDVPTTCLSLPNLANDAEACSPADEPQPLGDGLVGTLKLMLPAYLDRVPTVAQISEMAGISVRSFQRKLAESDLTYSHLLEIVRFENAAKLLRDTDAKIIDVALSSGYNDPAHFSRAFRRVSGITPREFREKSRSQ